MGTTVTCRMPRGSHGTDADPGYAHSTCLFAVIYFPGRNAVVSSRVPAVIVNADLRTVMKDALMGPEALRQPLQSQ